MDWVARPVILSDGGCVWSHSYDSPVYWTNSRVTSLRPVTHFSGQLFWEFYIKVDHIWWLLALGVPLNSLGTFFYAHFWNLGSDAAHPPYSNNSCSANTVKLYTVGKLMVSWSFFKMEIMPGNQVFPLYF